MNRFIAILATAAALISAASCSSKSADAQTTEVTETAVAARTIPANPDGTVHELTDPALYSPDARVEGLTVLYFNAIWSGPCRQLGPAVDELARKFKDKATFVSVDTDTYGSVLEAYAPGASVPAVVILRPDGGTETFTETADLLPAAKFEAIINSNL